MQLLFFRSFLTTLLALIVLAYKRINPLGPPDWKLRRLLALRGVFGTIGLAGMIFALKRLPIGDAVCISFTSPVITTLFARIFLKEKYEWVDAVGAVGALIGVILIGKPPFLYEIPGIGPLIPEIAGNETSAQLFGVVAALTMSVMTAGVYCAVRVIGDRVSVLVPVTWFCAMGTIMGFFGMLVEGWQPLTVPSVLILLAIGFSGFLGQSFMTHALQIEKASKASVCMYVQVICAFLWELVLFGTIPDWASVVGAFFIVAFVFVIIWRIWKEPAKEKGKPLGSANKRTYATFEEDTTLEEGNATESDYWPCEQDVPFSPTIHLA
eukprot:TRINITY_DN84321_c0_g1_i1.p1 TRINITY_DN84321_c0_g1~~TRINITY_DN84321_c0_g1_i1.p1  ORF type:complete len:377 (+),score=21.09 TRINITY_DN84321_c0_g1_i1:160-1131(+)